MSAIVCYEAKNILNDAYTNYCDSTHTHKIKKTNFFEKIKKKKSMSAHNDGYGTCVG